MKKAIRCTDEYGRELSEDLTGQTFGRLTAIHRTYKHVRGYRDNRYWFCECTCGGTVVVLNASLKSGGTKSCGCLQREQCATLYKHRTPEPFTLAAVKAMTREELLSALEDVTEASEASRDSLATLTEKTF